MPLFLPPLQLVYFDLGGTITCKIIIDRLIVVNVEGLTILTVCKQGCSQLNILYITVGQLCLLLSRAVSKMHNACVPFG